MYAAKAEDIFTSAHVDDCLIGGQNQLQLATGLVITN
jgi:hypothetical protein